ncbi:MAG: thioesterase family protein, partial [Akkermansia sp.]
MKAQHSTHHQVMFYDTDCGGVVHNLAYLRWVEECRTTMATVLNIDYVEMAKQQQFMVVVRHEVDYLCPALWGDKVTCSGRVEK